MSKSSLTFIGRREGMSTYQFGPHFIHAENKAAAIEMLKSRKSAEVFYVSETYSQVTPESAAHGDFSETGYEHYGHFMTLKELLKELSGRCYNCSNESSFYDADVTVDYVTGTEQQNCLHVTASKRNLIRLNELLRRQS